MATLGSSLAAPAVKASPGWPTRQPIKLIATFPPGGTADTISRILAPKLSAGLGAGGRGASPAPAAAIGSGPRRQGRSRRLYGVSPCLSAGHRANVYPKLPYNVVTDFTHVTLIGPRPTS